MSWKVFTESVREAENTFCCHWQDGNADLLWVCLSRRKLLPTLTDFCRSMLCFPQVSSQVCFLSCNSPRVSFYYTPVCRFVAILNRMVSLDLKLFIWIPVRMLNFKGIYVQTCKCVTNHRGRIERYVYYRFGFSAVKDPRLQVFRSVVFRHSFIVCSHPNAYSNTWPLSISEFTEHGERDWGGETLEKIWKWQ